tara:strand:+ start:16360 stop:18036 length:1677 start_codon:yes stop_codon:yes gene_type:complete
MSATIELKYFNSFWIKKMDTIMDVRDTKAQVLSAQTDSTVIPLVAPNNLIGVGQRVKNPTLQQTIPDFTYVESVDMVSSPPTITLTKAIDAEALEQIDFGPIEDFKNIPNAYASSPESDWYAEESRIRGGYNNTNVDLGVKAYIVEEDTTQNHRSNSIIYSGIFNSNTGVNETNQFPTGQDITRAVDPRNGTIQKLYSEDTNLIVFQENKVNRALIDKDAIYTAEGGQLTTSGEMVIGQIVPYAGNYGISTNPESFAVYGYRKYFADRTRSAILRLSQDGITEISNYGMFDYFRDNLANVGNDGKIIGGWDMHTKQYTISMQPPTNVGPSTLGFDETVLGWTSRFSYIPNLMGSLRDNFYSTKDAVLWEHYSPAANYSTFYGYTQPSTVTFVFNAKPSLSKNFKTINYEGSPNWQSNITSLDSNGIVLNGPQQANDIRTLSNIEGTVGTSSAVSTYSGDTGTYIAPFVQVTNLLDMENSLFVNSFKKKEDKYFANIFNASKPKPGEILNGESMTGLKGFYLTVVMQVNNSMYSQGKGSPGNQPAELFAVSTNYDASSY